MLLCLDRGVLFTLKQGDIGILGLHIDVKMAGKWEAVMFLPLKNN